MKKENQIPAMLEEPIGLYITKFHGILSLLGFSKAQEVYEKFDFIKLIRKGISRKSLDHLMDATGISTLEMAQIFHTSDRTLRRYTADTILNAEQSERAIELAKLYTRGEEVFESLDRFKIWMDTSILALNNEKPKAFLDTSLGIELLMEELGRIEHGIFA